MAIYGQWYVAFTVKPAMAIFDSNPLNQNLWSSHATCNLSSREGSLSTRISANDLANIQFHLSFS